MKKRYLLVILALCCIVPSLAVAQTTKFTWPNYPVSPAELIFQVPSTWVMPPAIPAAPELVAPGYVHAGAVFGGVTVAADGVTDDTTAIQNALNAGDIYIATATYAISGNITIPTGRNIACQAGATLYDTQSLSTRMLQIGYSSSSVGNNSIMGCTLKGTDSAANYSTYAGGISGYSELLEIASGWGIHTDHVLLQDLTVLNGQGDGIITYSPCGLNNSGGGTTGPCNGGTPGTEGPSNIWIVGTVISHCAQPGIHLNGGQNIVVEGTNSTDCTDDDEVDSGVLQVMKTWWMNNTFKTVNGALNPLDGLIEASVHSCSADYLLPSDDSGCYSFNNTVSGTVPGGSGAYSKETLTEEYDCGTSGGHPGNYNSESAINGAVIQTTCP